MPMDRTDQASAEEYVERQLTRHGLGGEMTYIAFRSLRRDLAKLIVPTHSVSDARWFSSDTPYEMALRNVAIAIEDACNDVQQDRTHIDPVPRARRALDMGGVTTFFEQAETALKPRRSRCREILRAKGHRRLERG